MLCDLCYTIGVDSILYWITCWYWGGRGGGRDGEEVWEVKVACISDCTCLFPFKQHLHVAISNLL